MPPGADLGVFGDAFININMNSVFTLLVVILLYYTLYNIII